MTPLIVRAGWPAHPEWTGAWEGAAPSVQTAALALRWDTPSQLPPCSELVLVVPAAMLSWHRVALPRLPAGRWLSALHGLLEEKLLADPPTLHLALEPGAAGGREVMVIACDKAWLRQTLSALEQAGHRPARIVPEFEPDGSGTYLLGQPERGWLVHCSAHQVHCLPLPSLARPALQSWHGLHPSASVQAEPGLASLGEEIWGASPSLMQAGQHLRRAASSGWSLAQFDLSVRSGLSRRAARVLNHAWLNADWKPVRWGLAGVLAMNVLGLQAWAWKQEHQIQRLHHEIQSSFRTAFPQVPVVVDPVLQMERETQALAKASGQASQGDLAPMLAAVAALPGGAPGRIQYRPGELSLADWPLDAGAAHTVQASLAPQGYSLQGSGSSWTLRAAPPGAAP